MQVSKVQIFLFTLLIGGLFTLGSCKKSWACHEDNISSLGADDSHNKGMNCMQCHTASGEGEGCFNVAGTVYQSDLQNTVNSGKVELYTGPNGTGTLKYTIDIDSKGNFYTTANVDYTGLYPKVFQWALPCQQEPAMLAMVKVQVKSQSIDPKSNPEFIFNMNIKKLNLPQQIGLFFVQILR
jgi:hypothetical protein